MSRLALVLVVTLLAVSGCAGPAPPPAARADPDAVDSGPAWRRSFGAFEQHLARVEVGWSTERLRAHAGEPDERTGDTWFYTWIESGELGGMYCNFHFVVKERAVAGVSSGVGCIVTTGEGG